jgi:type II secretory pathway pseudopilin PulG
MTRRLRQEEGWALVTAVVVLMLMMMIGLATYSTVGIQTSQSKSERNREASFNLTEGALQEQGYVMGFNWPGTAGAAYPDCSSGGPTPLGKCPQPANLTGGNFTQPDYAAEASWKTVIRDNPSGSDFYDASVLAAPAWDSNGDRKLWVWATAKVRGKTRTIVALMKRERLAEAFPRAAVKADHFTVTNNGNKTLLDAAGGEVIVRCQAQAANCASYEASKNQVLPANSIVTEPAQTQPTMSDGQLARFKAVAQSLGTYYSSCPSSLTGQIVYIDVASGVNCKFQDNNVYNSPSSPGFLVMPKGTVTLRGGLTYYGVIYMRNCTTDSSMTPCTTGVVADIGGNVTVYGGVIIDGGGGLDIGSSGNGGSNLPNLKYSANSFNSLATFGTAGVVQNTWRELPGSG